MPIDADGRTVCGKCQHVLTGNDWPFCPHGEYRGGIERDEIPGGFVQENFGGQPEVFHSWSAMRKRADALGLRPFVKQLERTREVVGGGKAWLEAAEELAKRHGTAAKDDVTWHSFESSVRPIKSLSEVA